MADALSALVVLLLAWGAVQFVLVLVIGRQQSRLPRPASSCGGEDLTVIVLIACLDEAAVITGTVASIVEQPGVSVIVIDDGSDDDTPSLLAAITDPRVRVVRTIGLDPQAQIHIAGELGVLVEFHGEYGLPLGGLVSGRGFRHHRIR